MAAKKETKAGWKTTEFWLTSAAAVAGMVVASGVVDPDGAGTWDKVVGLIVSTLAALGYTASRAKVKASE